jgi:polysaccharide export outer membrane protein
MIRLRVDDLLSLGTIGRNLLQLLVVAGLSGSFAGVRAQQPAGAAPGTQIPVVYTARPQDQQYRIGVGDVLDVRVFNKPQFSREGIRVGGSGTIRLPFVETEVTAVCKTESQLSAEISEKYTEYLRSPQVDVYIREYNSQPVAVMGAVRQPSRMQLRSRTRLLDLLSYAGGLTEKAGRTVEIVHTLPAANCDSMRGTELSEDAVARAINTYPLKDALAGVETANPVVNPGDIVTVPEADQAFVVGNVVHPSILLLKEPITLTRAIAMAGGLMPDTKKEKIRVTRQGTGGSAQTEMLVDLNAIEKKQAQDVVLISGDIVEVPVSEGKRMLKTLLGSVIPSVGQLPLRVVP